ncbi:MAG: YtxH domain-containing protein [Pedobacter sp.]|nr:MAG: YtxH domain-containing protein [Pedobacter sp.]
MEEENINKPKLSIVALLQLFKFNIYSSLKFKKGEIMQQSKILTGILAGAAIGGVVALILYNNRSIGDKSEDLAMDFYKKAKRGMRKGGDKLKSKFEETIDKLDRSAHKAVDEVTR